MCRASARAGIEQPLHFGQALQLLPPRSLGSATPKKRVVAPRSRSRYQPESAATRALHPPRFSADTNALIDAKTTSEFDPTPYSTSPFTRSAT